RELRRQAGPASLPSPQDHERRDRVSDGIVARLRAPLAGRADFSAVLEPGWTSMSPAELARRPVSVAGRSGNLGDLFELSGEACGRIRFEGDLRLADRLAAGLVEG